MSQLFQQIFPASLPLRARSARGYLLVSLLLAALLAAALSLRAQKFEPNAQSRLTAPLQSYDAARQILFLAREDGSIRVLNLRNTVSEIGVLRTSEPLQIRGLQLADNGRALQVLGDEVSYVYDTRSLRLIARQTIPALASNSSPMQAEPAKLLR